MNSILVVVEQREGKLNRVSWETIAAGQAIAAQTGWTLEAAVAGSGVSAIATEVAAKNVAKVYDIESARLEPYTPDAFTYALHQFLAKHPATLVLMPHTYQVRDFVPKLATALQTTAISDVIGFKYEGGKPVFTRQMFQGKFVADVSFSGSGPCFVTFQNGSFRADKVEAGAGAAPVETAQADIPEGVVRNRPQEVSKKPSKRSILRRQKLSCRWGGASRSRRILRWPSSSLTPWAARSPLRVPFAITHGCPWIARSDRQGRPSPRSFIWRSGSRARSSTLSA